MAVPMDSLHSLERAIYNCQNYRTGRLISHLKEVIMEVVLNRLKAKPEKIIADKQAGFTAVEASQKYL